MNTRVFSVSFLALCWLMLGTSAATAQSQCDAAGNNLVTNCGFETGDFSGWSLDGNNSFSGVDGSGPYTHSGTFGAFLGAMSNDGFNDALLLSQTVGGNAIVYTITYWLRNDGGTPSGFEASWNGVVIPGSVMVDAGAMDWTEFSFQVTGNSGTGSNMLLFTVYQNQAYFGLDDVVVTNTPEPGTIALFGSGILGLAGLIRRRRID